MRTAVLVFIAALAACRGGQLSSSDTARIRAEVEQVMRDGYDLSKPNQLERMLALYPSAGRVVSANTGRVLTSIDSVGNGIREFWLYVGANMRNPKWEWTNIYVDVLSRDAAVATGTYRIPHLNPNNQPHVLGGAMTMVFRRQDGRWVVIQEHLSDSPQTGQSTDSMATHENH
jgi:ketosteroid isomerase-like protein